jgi:hypothetical protein
MNKTPALLILLPSCLLHTSCEPLPMYGDTVFHQGGYRTPPPSHAPQGPRPRYEPAPQNAPDQQRSSPDNPVARNGHSERRPEKPAFRQTLETSNELRLKESEMMLRNAKARAAQGDAEAQAWVDEWEPKIKMARWFHQTGKDT